MLALVSGHQATSFCGTRSLTGGLRQLQTAGLFGSEHLKSPEDWREAANEAISRCKQTIQQLSATPASLQTVHLIDDVSDTICQVTDSAEFCRLAHTDPSWRSAATDACINLSGFIQELNTSTPLYEALLDAVDSFEQPSSVSSPSNEDQTGLSRFNEEIAGADEGSRGAEAMWVAAGLRRDFEAAGINLPGDRRAAADKLAAGIERLRMLIGWNATDPAQAASLRLPSGETVRLDQAAAGYILSNEPDAKLRKEAFEAFYHTPAANVGLMHDLLAERRKLAQLMGRRSFAHHTIGSHTLAGSPEAVQAFLDDLSEQLRPQAEKELEDLLAVKRSTSHDSSAQLKPEDQLFLLSRAKGGSLRPLLQLTLQGCLHGLSTLLSRVFGVTLRQEDLSQGEQWAPGVLKYALIRKQDDLLGHIYVDAFARPDKPSQAGHYTLRCGRRKLDGTYQLPLVALGLGFASEPLGMTEICTLFHEFGHALNSLLSRTEYQHFSGTRGPLDLVEVASHVMELFTEDPRVLQLLSNHGQSDQAAGLSLEEAAQWQRSRQHNQSLQLQHQVFLSRVDQRLHGEILPADAQTAQAIAEIEMELAVFPFAASGAPVHARFLHLVGYSSRYYSYLYAQCLAASIWQEFFAADPFNQDAGKHLQHRLLEPGGSQHPLQIVESVLGQNSMSPMMNGWGPRPAALLARLQL